jgi:hypothetical protein
MIDRYTIGSAKLFTAICDRCEAELSERRSLEDAARAMRAAGWQSIRTATGWRDYCPNCRDNPHSWGATGGGTGGRA